MKKLKFMHSCWLVVLCLSIVLVSACSKSNTGEEKGSAPIESGALASNATQSESSEPVDKYAPKQDKTYEFLWTYYQTGPVNEEAIMKKHWEQEFNVKFNVMNIDYTKAEQILNLKIAGGEIPDRIFYSSLSQVDSYYKQGIAIGVPLDVVQKHAPHMWAELTKQVPMDQIKSECIRGNDLICIPDVGSKVFRNPIVWRGDWLKNVGIAKTPQTLQEFEDALYKFANNDPDQNGKKDTYGLSKSGFSGIFGAFGIPWDFQIFNNWQVNDGKLVYSAIQPEAKQALELLHKWYKDGVIDPEFVTGENTGGYWALSTAFINGRIGYTSHGQTYHWQPALTADGNPGPDRAELAKLNPEAADQLILGEPPVGPEGKQGVWTNPAIKSSGTMFGKGLSEQPDKLGKMLEILDYPYIDELHYATVTSGIQGEMWEYKDQTDIYGTTHKAVQMIGDYANKTFDKNVNFMAALNPFSRLDTDNAVYDWSIKTGGDKFHLETALLAPLPSEAKYKGELTKLQDQAYVSIITGDKPIEYFDDFVKQWRSLGGEQLEKEANEWYSQGN